MAANHTKLIGLGVGAILAISAAPMYAEARQPTADTLKAEARSFVKAISGDQRKSRTYCKIVELNDQIDEKEDPIDARKLKKKRDKLEEKLGRKYIALVARRMNINKDSRDYRAIASILEPLDKLCTAIKDQHRRRTRQEHRRRVLGDLRKRGQPRLRLGHAAGGRLPHASLSLLPGLPGQSRGVKPDVLYFEIAVLRHSSPGAARGRRWPDVRQRRPQLKNCTHGRFCRLKS